MRLSLSKKSKEIISFSLLLLVGAAIYFYSARYDEVMMKNDPTDAFLPQVCGVAIALLSAVRIVQCVRRKDPEYVKKQEKKQTNLDSVRGVGSIVLIFLYVICYRNVGFLLSTMVYLFAQLTLFTVKGKRHWVLTAVISIGLPLLLHVLFVELLNFMLPAGIIG